MNLKKVSLIAIPTFSLASALAFPAAAFAQDNNDNNLTQSNESTVHVDQSNSATQTGPDSAR